MYFEDCQIGQQWSIAAYTITAAEIQSFAESYDPLPLHLDPDYIATTRYQRLIASGPLGFLSFWSRFLRNNKPFEEGLIAGISSQAEFLKPIYAGDYIHGTVKIVKIRQRNPYNGAVTFSTTIVNQDGQTVTSGHVEVCFELRTPTSVPALCQPPTPTSTPDTAM